MSPIAGGGARDGAEPARDIAEDPVASPSVSLRDLAAYFAKLGTTGFGGPVVLVERMRHDLVDTRAWISDAEYREGIALAQIAPGPLAAQVAIYLGWLRGGLRGATVAGIAFIAPSFLMVMALSALYVRYSGLSWMRGTFYGVGAAAIALIGFSAYRMVRKTAQRDHVLWVLVAINALATAWTEQEVVWLMLASGLVVLAARPAARRAIPLGAGTNAALLVVPPWWLTGVRGEASPALLPKVALFFAKAGAVVFGSGLAIVPYLHGGAVQELRWLTEQQFLDAVAVSMITPGPVVITVAFIGYLVAGPLGGIAAALGVFLPVYLFVVVLARSFQRAARHPTVRALVDGVTAAAAGAIAGAAIVLGRRALVDVTTWALFAVALLLIVRVRRVPEPLVLLAAGIVGLVLA